MLATFVIGLREGLEAALIVGIIAAFLKRNGHSLKSMWIGVFAAIGLSIAVGVILEIISVNLPQAQQEGMESIIGMVAVVMVTFMIVWMSKHARNMRKELESTATDALKQGSVFALAGMAFLAVLREGFETSVFLLAAFQSSVSPLTAGLGAVLGLLLAVCIGYGIYRGGVKLNLGKFFTVTGVFLVFVAAGLVMSSLRTAHEAGWITIGQDATLDLSWLAPAGSVQAALVTGVLGIPADPRVIEVLGWAMYLVPVLLFVLWPHSMRPGKRAYRVQFGIAAACAAVAITLIAAVPASAQPNVGDGTIAIIAADGSQLGTARLTGSAGDLALQTTVLEQTSTVALEASAATTSNHLGEDARTWSITTDVPVTSLPTTLTLAQLATLNGGRTPVGVSPVTNPGPFGAEWQATQTTQVWVVGDTLLDATNAAVTTLTLSGGGLSSTRTVTVSGGDTAPQSLSWAVATQQAEQNAAAISEAQSSAAEAALFKLYLPIVLLIAALVLCAFGARGLSEARRADRDASTRLGDDAGTSAAPDSAAPDSSQTPSDLTPAHSTHH
ncbi:iron uptake transporter permease EfeU [Subtercola endophyticus]|uniref:iron uptake transporter permease EfeU n=1 Tax=Subtercola endophyticus TaxID=2895559 RepID=UPI001E36F24D|nr:iron uptake transporter permease EfeU [Subtercola endophyticus]UFS59899.1 FTR1 family protein [Subtercola endophyticus]